VNVVGTALGLAALVLVPFGLLRLSPPSDSDRSVGGGRVELPVAPQGFRSAALPYASIAYPDGWYLTDTSPLTWMGIAQPDRSYSGPVLQLSNFDPDLHGAPRCMFDAEPIPDDGVMLTVGLQAAEDTSIDPPNQAWPVELGPYPPDTSPQCEQGVNLIAGWVAPSGASYWANATFGKDAADADHRSLVAAFASLVFPPTPDPWMTTFAADQGQGSPRLVLDSATFEGKPLTLMVFLDHYKVVSIGVSAPDDLNGSCCLGGTSYLPESGSAPPGPVESSMSGGPDGAVVYGDASLDVVRAEIRTSDAATFRASLVPVPDTLGFERQVVWGFVEGSPSYAQAVGYDADGKLLGDPTIAVAPPEVFASGDDPLAGHWEAAITHETMGTGMTLTTANGGGGSCCLQPDRLEGVDLALSGTSSGGDGSSTIEVLATTRVARVEAAMANGERFEAGLYPFPDGYVGPAQYALVFVPAGIELRGDLIAYDDEGHELDRVGFGDVGEPPGPTREIDEVFQNLRAARDALSAYFANEGTFERITLATIRDLVPDVAFNLDDRAVPHEVSVRVSSAEELSVVSTTEAGEVYCIGVQAGMNYYYGQVDATGFDDCRGGWGLPPIDG
jgi:hypothetical protein